MGVLQFRPQMEGTRAKGNSNFLTYRKQQLWTQAKLKIFENRFSDTDQDIYIWCFWKDECQILCIPFWLSHQSNAKNSGASLWLYHQSASLKSTFGLESLTFSSIVTTHFLCSMLGQGFQGLFSENLGQLVLQLMFLEVVLNVEGALGCVSCLSMC